MKKRAEWLKLAQVKELVAAGLTDPEIGRALGAETGAVKKFRLSHNLPCNPCVTARVGPAEVGRVRELTARGLCDAVIGRVLRVNREAVRTARRRHGIPPGLLARPIERSLVGRVKRLTAKGLTDRQIAAEVGRSDYAVRHIRARHGLLKRARRTAK